MSDRDEVHRQIDEQVEAQVEKGKESGQAWQEREVRMAGDLAKSDDKLRDIGNTVAAEAFMGQDATELLGDPPFEAASESVLDQPLLVIAQDAKVVEVSDRYNYSRPDGTPLAIGEQTNQSSTRKLMRMASSLDSMMKSVIEVTQDDKRVFGAERKGSVGKNTIVISDAEGNEVGEVKQTKKGKNKASFELRASGKTLATMRTGRMRDGQGYDIVDTDGALVAYVRRINQGAIKAMTTSMMTNPDMYGLRVAQPLTDPLRTLVVATPMAVDSAISQKDDGIELSDVSRLWRKFT